MQKENGMSSKKNNNQPPQLASNDISTIQNILFGQHIQEIERHFSSLEDKLSSTKDNQAQNLQELRKQTDSHLNNLEKKYAKRFEDLEAKLEQQVNALEQQIANVSKSDKENLAAMLHQLSVSLIKAE